MMKFVFSLFGSMVREKGILRVLGMVFAILSLLIAMFLFVGVMIMGDASLFLFKFGFVGLGFSLFSLGLFVADKLGLFKS